jgi:predicted RNase H-like nuclease (RuvC/YqgF family)
MYTVKQLKQKFFRFAAAKAHFEIKASGWQSLCDKVNIQFKDERIAELEGQVKWLKLQNSALKAHLAKYEAEPSKIAKELEEWDWRQVATPNELAEEAIATAQEEILIKKLRTEYPDIEPDDIRDLASTLLSVDNPKAMLDDFLLCHSRAKFEDQLDQ